KAAVALRQWIGSAICEINAPLPALPSSCNSSAAILRSEAERMPFSTADAGSKCRAEIGRSRSSPARLRQKVVCDFQRDSGAVLVPGGKTKQIERTALRIPQHFWLVCDRKK